MASVAPPRNPPVVTYDDGDGLRRVRSRLRLIAWALLTMLVTAWLVSLGPIPGVLAVVTAKHILVAILVMGLEVDKPREDEGDSRGE